jgi:hypothetical protein
MNNYRVGQRVRVTAIFKNASEQLADPSAVILYVDPPSADTITYTFGVDGQLVKDAVGNYHCDFVVDDDGDWAYEWKGTGVVQAADDGILTVSAREVT